jgi:hypothetical protein
VLQGLGEAADPCGAGPAGGNGLGVLGLGAVEQPPQIPDQPLALVGARQDVAEVRDVTVQPSETAGVEGRQGVAECVDGSLSMLNRRQGPT